MGTIITIIVIVVIFLILLFASSYIKAKPDEAVMISGAGKRKILIGKAGFRIPFLQRKDTLHLKAFQVDVKTEESIPTKEFININVDAVANLKISSDPELLEKAFQALLCISETDRISQVQQVLQGNLREIIGTVGIRQLVQDRQGVAEKVKENVIPDMEKLGIELINFNIQNFSDNNRVIENLGIDNISQISKDAAIAKANADKEVTIAKANADEIANRSRVEAERKIIEQNTELSLKQSELKQKTDTAKAMADAAYNIEEQKRQQEINIASINADIAKREREVELGQKEVELQERKLQATINKKAEAEKYAANQQAEAELFARQKAAEAKKYELEQEAEMQKIKAEADKIEKQKEAEALLIQAEAEAKAEIAKANALKQAAIAEAEGIEAKGKAEAEAILAKADAMKQYGEAATLQLILDSNVLPEIVKAQAEPLAKAYEKVGNITMFGSDCQGKLASGVTGDMKSLDEGLKNSLGIDVKSLLAGFLGGKLVSQNNNDKEKKEE